MPTPEIIRPVIETSTGRVFIVHGIGDDRVDADDKRRDAIENPESPSEAIYAVATAVAAGLVLWGMYSGGAMVYRAFSHDHIVAFSCAQFD